MDRSSEFIKDKALFGSYPTQEAVEELEYNNVKYFIDLTCTGEKKITPYKTNYTYIKYPIIDHRVPTDWNSFAKFILKLSSIIQFLGEDEKVYIHCKGGHGRSGIVVACLLCYLYGMSPSEAISKTSRYHSKRVEMREKWRRIGSPQTRSQKHFISKFFEPLYIYENCTQYYTDGFLLNSDHPVFIKNIGMFPTAESAFFSFKCPLDEKYINKLQNSKSTDEIYRIEKTVIDPPNWKKIRISLMYMVLYEKFIQNKKIQSYLLNTGLRPIKFCSIDLYWGVSDNKKQTSENILGKLLVKLRKNLYEY